MPPRFFCESLPSAALPDPCCTLGPEESRHARKALRLAVGDAVELFDGSGALALAVLTTYRDGLAVCRVQRVERRPAVVPRLTVASAVPKGPRADAMVNDLAQLGVDRFVPLRCARGVVDPRAQKLDRLERAAIAAAKQSGRLTLMEVSPTLTPAQVLEEAVDVGLLLDPNPPPHSSPRSRDAAHRGDVRGAEPAAVHDRLRAAAAVTLLVGPEGGWTRQEIAAVEEAGYGRWRINANVLRIEAAAAAAAAVVRYVTQV